MSYSYYGSETDNMLLRIQAELESRSYNATKLLRFFKALGNIKNIGEGMKQNVITRLENMEPGQIIYDVQGLPDNTPKFGQLTTDLCLLGVKLQVPMDVMDRWRNNSLVSVDVDQIVTKQLNAFTQQIDNFLAYGDDFKNPRKNDPNAGQGKWKGLFNYNTATAAGDGEDNDMSAAGDYISTLSNYIEDLEDNGFESEVGYYMFSDNVTKRKAQRGNHFLGTVDFVTEKLRLEQDPELIKWTSSPNFMGSGLKNRIVLTNPFISLSPENREQRKFAFYLLQGYPLSVRPLNGGSLNDSLNYTYAILWSGALEMVDSTSVIRSGDLAF